MVNLGARREMRVLLPLFTIIGLIYLNHLTRVLHNYLSISWNVLGGFSI